MFDVKDGVAEWRKVYDVVRHLPVDGEITYDRLDAILGRDFREDRSPIARCLRELQENDSRTLANVRGKGYRVVRADEHLGLARRKHRGAHRTLVKAKRIITSADRNLLSWEAAQRMDALEKNVADQIRVTAHLGTRVAAVEAKSEEQDDRLLALEARLERLERNG